MYAKYRDFKAFFESEGYFEFVNIKCFRDYLVKLRLGLLTLNNSAFSSLFSRDTPDGCDYCGEFEDEKHLICFCPLYENIRVKYLSGLLTGPQCYNNLLRCDTMQGILVRLYFMQCAFVNITLKTWHQKMSSSITAWFTVLDFCLLTMHYI